MGLMMKEERNFAVVTVPLWCGFRAGASGLPRCRNCRCNVSCHLLSRVSIVLTGAASVETGLVSSGCVDRDCVVPVALGLPAWAVSWEQLVCNRWR
ncbi:hypothetical protein E2C01_038291 [Portunus trituberculatus]|uniref:Uncharacterized protein n=1 Tax=Portunus trituberculatus TaxID=210409 RepID=A0A5B7FJL5_PORTR|nr:hypothetical protein [Portunus trituberculatus]